MKTIDAIKDKVVAKVLSKEEKTKGGIVIPDSVEMEPQAFGEVISVGNEVEGIHRGDTIIFHVRGGQEIVFEEENYKCLAFNEIYGKIRETKS